MPLLFWEHHAAGLVVGLQALVTFQPCSSLSNMISHWQSLRLRILRKTLLKMQSKMFPEPQISTTSGAKNIALHNAWLYGGEEDEQNDSTQDPDQLSATKGKRLSQRLTWELDSRVFSIILQIPYTLWAIKTGEAAPASRLTLCLSLLATAS